MDEILVRIWNRDEYEKRDKDNKLHLGKMISTWHIPVFPIPGDYIEIDGNQKRIATIKRIFKPKNNKLLVEILIQIWENDRDLIIEHFVPSKMGKLENIENRENIHTELDWQEI